MIRKCSDMGNYWCPCRLAELGACVQCKKLIGKGADQDGDGLVRGAASPTQDPASLTQECNDCNWEGVCIYNQFVQDGRKTTDLRQGTQMTVTDVKHYSNQLVVLVLHCGLGFAQQTLRPRSFVFCRAADRESEFDVPLSVLHRDISRGEIHIAINPCGPKTRDLIRAVGGDQDKVQGGKAKDYGDETRDDGEKSKVTTTECEKALLVRGPYYSGLVGLSNVKVDNNICKGNLIIAKGLAIASGWNIFLLVSPFYYKLLAGDEYEAVRPNHANMCCGEGICGACSYTDENGDTVRMCKCEECASAKNVQVWRMSINSVDC